MIVSEHGEQYISITDALKLFGVSKRTLYNWMDAGKVQWVFNVGGHRLLAVSSLRLRCVDGADEAIDVKATLEANDSDVYEFLGVRR